MLSQDEVLRLHADLGDRKVLSVYINGEETDPAERRAWRIRLSHMAKDLQARVAEEAPEDRDDLRSAFGLIEQELAHYTGLLPERGWVGYATSDRLWSAGTSSVPMPDLVRWEISVHVTPYIRALKQSRPVLAIVTDQRHARVFRYQYGTLEEVGKFEADFVSNDTGPSSSKRPSTHSGSRGETRIDATRRMEGSSTQRMLREVVAAIPESADENPLMVVAGNAELVTNLMHALPDRVRERTIDIPALKVDATSAELKEAVETAASALSLRLQRALVEKVIEAARSEGRGALGRERTERALEAGAVETLVLSRTLSRAEPDYADRLVDMAIERSATVEEISESAAAELDREGGIGARLRFVV
jgi:hypothetical protein